MDLTQFTPEQLGRSLETLQQRAQGSEAKSAEQQEIVQDLQVHRVELEMQNRALRETQVELESAVQRYSDLYDHLPIGYVTLTPHGRIVQANLTAAGWLHRDRDSLEGGYLNWFFDAFDAGRFAAHLENCVRLGQDALLDVTLRLDSGLLLTVQFSSRSVAAARQTGTVIHTAITNIAKVRQAQEILADIHREQEALNGTIARDLRTPLVTLSNFAQTILRNHGDRLDPEVKSMVERMQGAALRTEATLHQLLEFCCLGNDEIALDPLSLDHVIQQVMVEHRATLQRHGAELVLDRPLPCVRGSRLILTHVLANVLTQKLRARPAGGALRLRLSAETKDKSIVLKIAEEISWEGEATPDQQFRAFERKHGGGTQPGTNLALAIISRAIERMNGRMWSDSEADQGTSIYLELPKA